MRWQIALGKSLGVAAYRVLPSRRRVVERNLEACFPGLSRAERDVLVREHFAALGASLVEMAMGWFGNEPTTCGGAMRVEGAEHLHAALAAGQGVDPVRRAFHEHRVLLGRAASRSARVRPACTSGREIPS